MKRTAILGSTTSTLALFENEIFRNGNNNNGQGIQISGKALIKGNRILDTAGASGDGILAQGQMASLVVQDNQIEKGQRMGITLRSGALARISRNRILDNQDWGLHMNNATSEANGNVFTGNGRGIQIQDSDLTLFDSLVAASTHSTDGHAIVATDSFLNVYNNTLSGNPGFGIKLSNETGTIQDSILYQNEQGDLSGASNAIVTNNLIGDGQLTGSDGNFAADPLFSSSSTLDFSLTAESPAIDRGSTKLPLATGLIPPPVLREDLLFHQRPVDGDGDGIAQIDLGAIEFGSSTALPLILPVLSSQSGEFVGLALANAFHEAAQLLLRAYNPKGAQVGSYGKAIPAGGQFALLLAEAFPDLKEGWIEIVSTQPDLMSFTLLGDYKGTFMDGAALARTRHRKLLFPEVDAEAGEQTEFFLINPNDQEVTVTWSWIRPDGSSIQQTRPLVGRGMIQTTFAELFGAASGSGGYVTAEAGQPLCGMELFGSSQSRGGLLGLDYEKMASRLFAAHLASGSDVETILNIINNGPATHVTLEALDEKGQLIDSVLLEDLQQGEQYRAKSRDIFEFPSQTVVGWLRISAESGSVVGNIRFRGSSGQFLAALPLQNEGEGAREFLLSHVAETAEMFTGVTLLNTSSGAALVSLEVFDQDKNLTGLSLLELAGGQKKARLLKEFVPKLNTQAGGFIRLRSNVPLFAFELFGRYSLDLLSAVPQQAVVH